MNHKNILEKLFQIANEKNVKLLLERVQEAHQIIGSPANSFPTIHIAGTNGKGSVALKIAKGLEFSGYRVGLYTSPHVFEFSERIQLNGTQIDQSAIQRHLGWLMHLIEIKQLPALSFFEITTLLAFQFFKEEKVDVAVIETGMGGRLDATNIIQPVLSVITSIGEDHIKNLGPTLNDIAREKAGIIKEHTPVILGPGCAYKAVYERSSEVSAPVIFLPDKNFDTFDDLNSETAYQSLNYLQNRFDITPQAMTRAVAERPICRFEIHEINGTRIVIDTAHNPPALAALIKALKARFFVPKFRFIVGFSREKDHNKCFDEMIPFAEHIHLIEPEHERIVGVDALYQICMNKKFDQVSKDREISLAFHRALHESQAVNEGEQVIVITGSFFIMPSVKKFLQKASKNLHDVTPVN